MDKKKGEKLVLSLAASVAIMAVLSLAASVATQDKATSPKNLTAPPKISQLLPSQCIEEEPKPLPFSARLGRTDDQEIVRSRLPSLIVTFQYSPTSFSYDLEI
ncbi:hypothetical protein H6P81_003222 [Aristolochia fimbriata]|uniref:Uncharacterized protein n=1 Tax=Aristolochia fimbriata TaxID=158543 RepID=A0AAV7FCJ1_ARIFI|nr:hypothetical protein H6P81_003222 [Aristolochia fimbriata]